MKSIILAAGYATRLYPLTLNQPKALLNINGKPIIEYIINELETIAAIDEVYIVSNDRFAVNFQEWLAGKKFRKPVKILNDGSSDDNNKLGAIGDIRFGIEEEKIDDDLMIIAGDNFFTYKLADYYDYFLKVDRDCVVVKELNDREQLKQFAVAHVDETCRVVDLVEKPAEPQSDLAVYATYIYKRDTLPLFDKYAADGNKLDAPGYFVQWLYKLKDVRAYKMDGDCFDIGTPAAYNEVLKIFGGDGETT